MSLDAIPPSTRRHLRFWLLLCLMLVAAMVWLGGMTRLTESGLSMVEWKPLHLLPPMDEAEWQEEFAKYQLYPEYRHVNRGMELAGFQRIFWLEYLHRLLGRGIGLVFFLPLLGFACLRRVPAQFLWQLGGIFALGGLQGVIGWVMVHSGLQADPWVSPVKLALHLGTAFVIFALILWQFLRLHAVHAARYAPMHAPRWAIPALRGVTALAFAQILLGALVAGRDAGMIYNSYPTMDGQWLPDGLYALTPWWRNAVENIAAIQFHHRLGAHAAAGAVLLLAAALWHTLPALRRSLALRALAPAVLLQFGLGVWTLVHQVPLAAASLHQMGALLLWAVLVALNFRLESLQITRNSLPGLTKFNDNGQKNGHSRLA